MRRTLRWLPLVLGLVAALGISVVAYRTADHAWNQIVDYRGPYASAQLPAAAAGPRTARRVVYVIIDGLREDASREMPTLERLRGTGMDLMVTTEQPSLSFPNWTTLMTGAPQRFSGVTTNWYDECVRVETLVDTALDASRTLVVATPWDYDKLYDVRRTPHRFLRNWEPGSYISSLVVDQAIELSAKADPDFVLVHMPDVDEAGHAYGGASPEYAETVAKVDADLARLVAALESSQTAFVIASDHGHVDTGGHGGWEADVIRVPVVMTGASVMTGKGEWLQSDVAPTVAMIAGIPAPRNSIGRVLPVVAHAPRLLGGDPYETQRAAALAAYTTIVGGSSASVAEGQAALDGATRRRLDDERVSRILPAALIVLMALALFAVIGVLSWRALVAALAGVAAYYLVYEGLFFWVHHHSWSLTTFRSEQFVNSFMAGRMVETVISGLVAAAVAADVYLVMRRSPRRPTGKFLPGWLSLGVATVLAIQASLALQLAWYVWYWGVDITWFIPTLKWGFKFDLDLIQMTALGVAALLAPLVTYLVGRYHPLRPVASGEGGEPEAAAGE